MSRTPESNGQTRENAATHVSLELRQKLREKFAEKYKPRGRSRALMEEFLGDWCRELDTQEPSKETVRQFLVHENGRDTFEYRIVDGSCRLLLGCSFDEWINSPKQAQDTPQELSSPPQSNSETCYLNEAIPAPLGKLSNVPNLPLNFLPRPDELKAIKTAVLVSTNQSVAVTGTAHRVGVQGMGGIGKSVLTAAIARDEEVRCAFPDGVLWVTLGQTPMLTSWQSHLAEVLGAGQRTFTDVQLGKAFLGELLADKACLLILDDVWQAKHAAAFDALGQRCKMLLTTRDRGLITALGAVEYQLGVLSNEQALALLALWAGQHEETLPTEAHEVVRECGNLPLALAMIGAMVRGKPDRWVNVLHKLRNADLEKIRVPHQFLDYPYSDLLKAIQVSVEDLEPDVQRRYLDFAVFPEDTPIPEATLQTFWELEGLDKHDTQDVVDLLVERSLARRDEKGCLSLHDLQHDYVRKQAGDLSALHNRLLSTYNRRCPDGWHTYPTNDGYFFEHLAYHLKESGQKDELYKLLTQSSDWMQAKFIACTGDASYAADLDLALSDFADPLKPKQLLVLIQLYVARQAVNQRVICYNDTDLKTLVWLGREAEALTYARLRPDAKGKFDGLLAIYKALQEKGQPKPDLLNMAWEITRMIQDEPNEANRRVEALSNLMVALAQSGRNDEVHTLFEQAQEVLLEVREIWDAKVKNSTKTATKSIWEMLWVAAHSKLASALFLAGQEEEAVEFFRKAETLANTLPGLRKVGAWITLVEELAQARQFTEAERVAQAIVPVWEELTEEIIDSTWATVTALSKLAVVLTQTGSKDKANAVLAEAREIAKSLQDDQFEDEALGELEAAKSTILAQLGNFKQSEEVARKIESNKHRTQALRELAVAMAKTEQPEHKEKASLLLNEVETIARTARNEYLWNLVLVSLTAALARSQHFTEAEKVIWVIDGDIEAQTAQASALIALAAGLAKVGNFKKAKEIAQAIEGSVRYKRFYALKDIAIALAQAENDEASQVFAQAVEEAWRYGDLSHRVEALSTIAVAMVQAGGKYKEKASEAFAKAEEITRAIRDGLDYRPLLSKSKISREDDISWYSIFYLLPLMSALTHLAKAWAKVGRVDKALMFFGLAEEIVQKIEEIRSPLSEYSILSQALAEVGYFDMAEIMARMNGFVLYYVKALIALEVALAEAGEEEKKKASAIHAEVMELVQYERNTISSTKDLSELGIDLGKAGYFVEATNTLGQESLDQTLSKLAEWIDAFEKVEPGLSLAVLREALRIAGWVHPGWQDIYEMLPISTTS